MKQLNITNKRRSAYTAAILSVASDGKIGNKHPLPSQSPDRTNVSTAKVVKRRCRIPQQWTVSGDTASADIGGGNIAVVDLVDLPLVQGRVWFPYPRKPTLNRHTVYASHGLGVLMHRLVMGLSSPSIDHIDNNGLNNRRGNLRPAGQGSNMANRRKHKIGTSAFKGVFKRAGQSSWSAQITKTINGAKKRFHLGNFATEELAALAYDRKALELFGSFAKLNFPVISHPNQAAA